MLKHTPKLKICILALCIFFLKNTQAQNNCLNFDGTNDVVGMNYHQALDFSINDEFTIEAWIKTSSSYGTIFSNKITSAPYKGYEFSVVNGQLSFELVNDYLSNKLAVVTLMTVNDNYWHHVACVYNGVPNASGVKLLIDGVSLTTNCLYYSLTGSTNSNHGAYIGTNVSNSYFFNGNIDEVRVWNKALCAYAINTCTGSNLTGTENNLVAYYQFNQGTASGNNTSVSTLNDLGPNSINGTLTNFMLSGSSSNWLSATNGISGTCTPFEVNVYATGPSMICAGETANMLAIGANSYTWTPVNLQGSVVNVTPAVTTVYTLTGETNGCTGKTTYTLTVDPCVGLSPKSNVANEVQVFPNPFSNSIKLNGLSLGSTITIYNVFGEIVFKDKIIATETEVWLADIPQGTYFLEIVSEKIVRRVVVKE